MANVFVKSALIFGLPVVGAYIAGRLDDSDGDSTRQDSASFFGNDDDSADTGDWSDDYETQQRSRKVERYRGVQLRDMGGDTDKVKKAIDRVLGNPKLAPDFRQKVRAVDYAHELRHADGSAPTGFAGRGNRSGGGVISTRTANTDLGLYRNLAHELGHLVDGDSEEAAERYALESGVYEED